MDSARLARISVFSLACGLYLTALLAPALMLAGGFSSRESYIGIQCLLMSVILPVPLLLCVPVAAYQVIKGSDSLASYSWGFWMIVYSTTNVACVWSLIVGLVEPDRKARRELAMMFAPLAILTTIGIVGHLDPIQEVFGGALLWLGAVWLALVYVLLPPPDFA